MQTSVEEYREESNPNHKRRALLVVDNPVDRELAVALLESTNLSVVAAESAQNALNGCSGGTYDLVLVDLQLPTMNGFQFTEAFRRLESKVSSKTTAIVGLSLDMSDELRAQCIDAGMNDCLGKPFDPSEFSRVIDESLSTEKITAGLDAAGEAALDFLLDATALNKIRELETPASPGIFRRVLQLYVDESPALFEGLHKAVQESNADLLRRSAHSLKSSSAMIGALELSSLCKQLEDLGRSDSVAGASQLLAHAEAGFHAAKRQIEQTLTESAGDGVTA